MGDSARIYRLLLKLYPARFREEYSGPLERQFLDDYGDADSAWGRMLVWLRTLEDLTISIPAQGLHEMAQDLRYAFRVYRKRSVVTALAVVALALAIGGTTGVFSVLNALLLRGLPFKEPERLVQMEFFTNLVFNNAGFKGSTALQDWAAHSAYLRDATEFTPYEMTLSRTGEGVHARVAQTSANFFDVLGTEPKLGRAFAAGEDLSGRDPVAAISYGLWQQMFGGDPRALGQTIRLNGAPLTVIGVAPPAFEYPARTDLWTPLRRFPVAPGVIGGATIARLRPGVSGTQARAMFTAELQRAYPSSMASFPRSAKFNSLRDQLAGPVREASMVLLGLVAFVLLIACSNVAQLLLSRTTERRQELAMRAALGASRARLVQQLVTEALLLTVTAAAAGLVVAHWASRLAMSVQPPGQLASQSYTILDWRVMGFASGVAIFTGLMFGVMPARLLGLARATGVTRIRTGLVMLQAALTLVLLAGSVTLGRSFLKLLGTDLGFRADHVATLNVSLVGTAYDADQRRYYNDALNRLRTVPGVEAAGAVKYLPLIENNYPAGAYSLDSGERLATNGAISNNSTPGYFRAIGTDVEAGRDFSASDVGGAVPVAIVDEDFARPLGARIVGRNVTLTLGPGNTRTYTVVGVVRTIRMSHSGVRAQIYFPFEQTRGGIGGPGYMTFVARVHGDAAEYLPVLRDAVQRVDRSVPVYDVKTLDQRLSEELARPRFYTTAILFLAGFALLLAMIGIYGVAAYSVAQRTKEIGVRIAVGASPRLIRGLLLRQSLWPLAVGMAAGVVGAVGLGQYLQHLMDSAEPVGKSTCAAAAVVLIFAGAFAVWRATARVVRIDPMTVLRTD